MTMRDNIILFLVFAPFVAIVLWIVIQSNRINKFHKNIAPGDTCFIYIGEDRVHAMVMRIEGDWIIVRTTIDGKLFKRSREEIYI